MAEFCETYELACQAAVYWTKSAAVESDERADEYRNLVVEMERECQDFRVRAAIMDPKEVLDGTTQSSPHS